MTQRISMNKFSISQFCLALAIGYLAFSLSKIAQQIPTLVTVVDKTADTAEKFQPQIDNVIANVDAINQQIPNILAQIEQTRPLIDEAIKESGRYSQSIPALLEHLTTIEKQVADIQTQLPAVLSRIDQIVLTTDSTTKEVAKWRPHSTAYIEQIKHSREDIPEYLTRVEYIIEDAKTIGREASSGMVSGFFQGVVSIPFNVLSKLTGIVDSDSQSARHLTEEDIAILKEKTVTLLKDPNRKSITWRNKKSENSGTISKKRDFKDKGKSCHAIEMVNKFDKKSETLYSTMCKDQDGDWRVI